MHLMWMLLPQPKLTKENTINAQIKSETSPIIWVIRSSGRDDTCYFICLRMLDEKYNDAVVNSYLVINLLLKLRSPRD